MTPTRPDAGGGAVLFDSRLERVGSDDRTVVDAMDQSVVEGTVGAGDNGDPSHEALGTNDAVVAG